MTTISSKIQCSKCGEEMNFHAEKIVFGQKGGDETEVLAESLREFHACPQCGAATTRDAENPDY